MRAARAGHDVYMYVLTRGGRSGKTEERTSELYRSADLVGANTLWIDNFEDTQLSVNSRVINHIEYFVHKCHPDIIFTHPLNDYHHDHRAVAECTIEAARNSQNVLAYEIPVTKNFTPQLYYDISEVIDDKAKLIEVFASQSGKVFTLTSAVKGMGEYRALQNRLNSNISHAEAFEVLKLCVNADFTMMKLSKNSIPSAVLQDVVRDLSAIIEYRPQKVAKEITKSVTSERDAAKAVAPAISAQIGNIDKLLLSSSIAKAIEGGDRTVLEKAIEDPARVMEK